MCFLCVWRVCGVCSRTSCFYLSVRLCGVALPRPHFFFFLKSGGNRVENMFFSMSFSDHLLGSFFNNFFTNSGNVVGEHDPETYAENIRPEYMYCTL